MNIYEAISSLVFYGEKEGLIEKEDEISPKMSLVVDLVLDDNDKYRYEKFERMLEMFVLTLFNNVNVLS